jgi:hypothetical protein
MNSRSNDPYVAGNPDSAIANMLDNYATFAGRNGNGQGLSYFDWPTKAWYGTACYGLFVYCFVSAFLLAVCYLYAQEAEGLVDGFVMTVVAVLPGREVRSLSLGARTWH